MATTIEINGLTALQAEPPGQLRDCPILFIHGMGSGAWLWQNYLDFFSSLGYRCYALNLRGHHGSRPVPDIGKVSIYDYIADCRELAGELGNPILIGHSMGGLLVQKMAEVLDPPAVVAIAPAAPRYIFPLNSWALLRTFIKHSPEIFLGRPLIPSKTEMAQLALNHLFPEMQDWVCDNMVPESGRQTFDITVAGLPVDASKVQCPILVIGAAEDKMTPAKIVRKIAEKYHADYKEYGGFGHMVVIQPGWEQVADDIANWLDKQEIPGPAS